MALLGRVPNSESLSRDPPLRLLVVLDESVLRRRIGDESVMYEQLVHLAEVDESNVTLRILPFAGPHPVITDSFVIFRFGEEDAVLPDVVMFEGMKATFFVEGQQEAHLHRIVFNALLGASLDPNQSKELIMDAANSLRRQLREYPESPSAKYEDNRTSPRHRKG